MLKQFNTSGYIWESYDISIIGGEIKELNLDMGKPNMFVLQNPNGVDINVGISRIPTLYNYEFQVKANTTDTFGRPTSTTKIYLLNTGTEVANIKLFCVNDEFDMNILKNTNVSIDGATVNIADNGIIKGFQSGVSLPTGNNKIGKVAFDTTEKNLFETVKTLCANQNAYTQTIKNDVTNTYNEIVNLLHTMGNVGDKTAIYKDKGNAFTVSATDGKKTLHINYIMNDGCELSVKLGTNVIFTIYEGEQFADLEFEIPQNKSITIIKSSAVTDETATENFRMKYFTY